VSAVPVLLAMHLVVSPSLECTTTGIARSAQFNRR